MKEDQTQRWMDGKPPIIAGFAVVVAMAAEVCHELIASIDNPSRLWQSYTKLRRGPWLEYYADDAHLCRGVMLGLGWQDNVIQNVLRLAQMASWSRTNGESQSLRAALGEVTPEEWNKLRKRVRRYRAKFGRWKGQQLLADLDSEGARLLGNASWSTFWFSSAGQFFARVAMPCYVLHGRWPARAVRDATNRKRPNLKLLKSLAALDKGVVEVPRVRIFLHCCKPAQREYRWGQIAKAAKPKRISLKAVKYRLGRLIIDVADRLGVRLDSEDVRSLFDSVARREHGLLRDSDLAAGPWALTKGIQRENGLWDLPDGMDKKTSKHVHARTRWFP